jgi:short-subunit dehydrogenase involved in D-alanine esterification of teichoic acids
VGKLQVLHGEAQDACREELKEVEKMKVLVTGGTNGMGKGVAKVLAGSDNQIHEIIILCRSEERGEATIQELKDTTANNKISIVLCDLTKLSDVRNAIKEIHIHHEFLDGLFINAGLGYAAERIETEDGMDPHFQVNYLSQFMLTLNLLDLLEKSENGGRVIFNVTEGGEIFWDDMQMKKKWNFENGIHQAMVAKRMFYVRLHNLCRKKKGSKVSLIGFQISKTVWTNQINIIPFFMKTMATVMKFLGAFISIEECGMIMSPLFTEKQEESLKKSGKFITWKKEKYTEMKQDKIDLDKEMQDKLWKISLDLCKDEKTTQIADSFA